MEYYERNAELKQVIDMIRGGYFSPDAKDRYDTVRQQAWGLPSYFPCPCLVAFCRFHNLIDTLLVHGDRFCLLKDYEDYIRVRPPHRVAPVVLEGQALAFCDRAHGLPCAQVQDRISEDFRDQRAWAKRCILNVAAGGTSAVACRFQPLCCTFVCYVPSNPRWPCCALRQVSSPVTERFDSMPKTFGTPSPCLLPWTRAQSPGCSLPACPRGSPLLGFLHGIPALPLLGAP